MQLLERARLRKLSKGVPIGQRDIDLIKRYIEISEEEHVDFDLMPVYRLAYDVTLRAGTSSPAKEYWAEKYLELARIAKGVCHPQTMAFLEQCGVDSLP